MNSETFITDKFLEENKLTKEVTEAYLDSLILHIESVRQAGRKLGVNESQLLIHDNSKFTPQEFAGYARHFKGGGDPDSFSLSWLHHLHHNPHHWQHWIFPDGFTPAGSNVVNGCLPMPENYALEMVADWMGASFAYTKSWDMTEWLESNFSKVKLHPKTNVYITNVLRDLGYKFLIVG